MAGTLYIIHPQGDQRQRVANSLAGESGDTRIFASAEEFLLQVPADGDGCVVIPSVLAGMGARRLIETLRARHPGLVVIVLGRDANVATAVELVRAGASEYLEPAATHRRLRSAVRRAFGASRS